MSDQKYTPNDSYNELLRSYSNAQKQHAAQRDAAAQPRPPVRQQRPAGDGVSFNRPNNEDVAPRHYRDIGVGRQPAAPSSRAPGTRSTQPRSGAEQKKDAFVPSEEQLQEIMKKKSAAKKKRKRALRRKSTLQSFLLVALVLVFVFVASMMLKIPIMGCVNDLLAIDRSDTDIRVVVDDGMRVNDVIDLLAEKGLLYSGPFCKLAARILDYSSDEIYEGGSYDLSPSMGLEGMLKAIAADVKPGTVTLTFPEGYTVDQIVAKLSENNVASAESLYAVLDGDALVEKYDFLLAIDDRSDRYSIFEGYLYPDTYEFYIGDDPSAVFEKFLNNFALRWTEEYDANAAKLGMTVDEIVTMASILEKEANDAQQMPLIASILFNRIHSTSFAFINCDSTNNYLDSIRDKVASEALFEHLAAGYDTYIKTGLPVGAICNPGADALYAAMHPENTDYYYFLHDASGNIYVARTAAEHEANIRDHLSQ